MMVLWVPHNTFEAFLSHDNWVQYNAFQYVSTRKDNTVPVLLHPTETISM